MIKNALIMGVAVTGIAACVSPRDYETTPVQLQTEQGIVTCQLYSLNRVDWDRSINRPETMSVEQADSICVNEGYRILNNGQ
jgi:hypothetical protein